MIKHIVFYKLTNYSEKNCNELIEKFNSMDGKIEILKEVSAHADYLRSERSFDVVLEIIVDSKEDLDAYKKDLYHHEIVRPYVHSVISASASVDYEF